VTPATTGTVVRASRIATLTVLLAASACGRAGTSSERALGWLASTQAADGLWHSDTYALLERGESTTAALVLAMLHLPAAERAAHEAAIDRALAALASRDAPSAATPPDPIDYPLYTAAHRLHALAWRGRDGWRAQAEPLVALLRRRQLADAQGWPHDAPEYGGFGLGDRDVRHPEGADMVSLSVTTAVLEALAAARVPADDAMVRAARTFVERCQHFERGPGDGGFCFTPTRDWRATKAGFLRLGADEWPRSYGTATADGVRALLACGHDAATPRVRAALAWLEARAAERVPGMDGATDPTLEPSLRLYWFASLAAVARAVPSHPQALAWQRLAAVGAGALQHADGRFVGLGEAMKENDPLVATALGLWATAPRPLFR
jgi:hypothetical protein